LFERHAVVVEKSCDSDWRRRQQAKPACSFFSDDAAQTEIDTGRQTDSQHRTNKLPRGQAEKDGFTVRTDFFWNFDFYKNRLRFVENLTEILGYEIIFIGKNLTKKEKSAMNSTLILFKEIGRQLLIVGLVLGSLPMAIRILWKLRLLPLGCYFVATKLFWPRWAEAHRTACILLFIACILFFAVTWIVHFVRKRREEQIMAELIHHYTKDLKPGESRTLEFL